MPICPKCDVAFLDGEHHECVQRRMTLRGPNLLGLVVPLVMQAILTTLVGAVFAVDNARAEPMVFGSLALGVGVGFVLFTRRWSPSAKVLAAIFYCPVMLAILAYEHIALYFALFDGDSF